VCIVICILLLLPNNVDKLHLVYCLCSINRSFRWTKFKSTTGNSSEMKTSRRLLVLWTFGCLIVSNGFKSLISANVVLPITYEPLQFWPPLINQTHFPIYTFLETEKFLNLNRSFRYEDQHLERDPPRSSFEEQFCLKFLVFNTSSGEFKSFCSEAHFQLNWLQENLSLNDLTSIKVFNRMKIIGKDVAHEVNDSFTFYYGTRNFPQANELISSCDGQVLVDTSEKIEIYRNKIFRKRSGRKNLEFTKSLDEFPGTKVLLQYEKFESYVLDKLVRISFENGLYDFWWNLFSSAKMQRNLKFNFKQNFQSQNLNSNLSTIFLLVGILYMSAILFLAIESSVSAIKILSTYRTQNTELWSWGLQVGF